MSILIRCQECGAQDVEAERVQIPRDPFDRPQYLRPFDIPEPNTRLQCPVCGSRHIDISPSNQSEPPIAEASTRKSRFSEDDYIRTIKNLISAARARENVMGDPISLLNAKARLATAVDSAQLMVDSAKDKI